MPKSKMDVKLRNLLREEIPKCIEKHEPCNANLIKYYINYEFSLKLRVYDIMPTIRELLKNEIIRYDGRGKYFT